ncbi:Exopolysaccharide II synthesis transcriptional activator ExpG [Hyphomicrobiales bacterium]|nr:Exopolysaccharide II synthesis transcriptional activator ExpG [Hyphomicrobiales bacterium]CAH1698813.1 DNA-binding MarR family transcriptional regulator [Hyphomicrobiales bacterium]CAI0342459.1 Exopolysaccharide II synthesis transcriptional activator ExpG [Hyphomicrobiales bacterium]
MHFKLHGGEQFTGSSLNGHHRANGSGALEEVPDRQVSPFDLARVIERVSRRFLDYLRLELTKLGIEDISPSQVMVLMTIGQGEIAVRDLLDRGHYGGSNASYNLKQLVENGYLDRGASPRDRRQARISLSLKGQMLCERLRMLEEASQFGPRLESNRDTDLNTTHETLRQLEQWWNDALRYGGVLLASCMSSSFIAQDLVNSLL